MGSSQSYTRAQLNHKANQNNPNNCQYRASLNNRANQLNPNYRKFKRKL